MDGMVVRDDVSARGLRRLHVMRAERMTEGEAQVWAAGVVRERVTNQGGRLEGLLVYEDFGMWHARVYFRV